MRMGTLFYRTSVTITGIRTRKKKKHLLFKQYLLLDEARLKKSVLNQPQNECCILLEMFWKLGAAYLTKDLEKNI